MLLTLLEKLPLSQGGKVFFGTSLCLAICAYPVIRKRAWRLSCLPVKSLVTNGLLSFFVQSKRPATTSSHPRDLRPSWTRRSRPAARSSTSSSSPLPAASFSSS
jgi:hypothetical protein